MDEQANKLLMMFINDGYSSSGKISKKTAIAMMKFVESTKGLQVLVNNGDTKSILQFDLSKSD